MDTLTYTTCGLKESLVDIMMCIRGPWQQLKYERTDEEGGQLFRETFDYKDALKHGELAYYIAQAMRRIMVEACGRKELGGKLGCKPGDTLVFHGPVKRFQDAIEARLSIR